MKYNLLLVGAFMLALAPGATTAGAADLSYPPTSSAGHDFNHSPVGQTFRALATDVEAGIFIADQDSFSDWLKRTFHYNGQFPYAIATEITVSVQLFDGAGTGGALLDSEVITLTKPFMGFVSLNYAERGIQLEKRHTYTLLLTDVSNQSYPDGVTGWVVPATAPDAYRQGDPILQGMVVTDPAVGDNAFEVLDLGGTTPAPLAVSGTLPYGEVGVPYAATLTASGGEPPYQWFGDILPAWLSLEGDVLSGTPGAPGIYDVDVAVQDSLGDIASAQYTVLIYDAGSPCDNPGADPVSGKGRVQSVGVDSVVVSSGKSSLTVDYASCTAVEYGGSATEPAVGDRVEWQGYLKLDGHVMAQTLTFN